METIDIVFCYVFIGIMILTGVFLLIALFFSIFPSLTPEWLHNLGCDEGDDYNLGSYGGSTSEDKNQTWDNNNINLMQNF